MKILNLTQHQATPDQVKAGVVEPSAADKEEIKQLLTFNSLPDVDELAEVADSLAQIASEYTAEKVMIGGAPYLMPFLEDELHRMSHGFKEPVYAFSKRVVEEKEVDGKVEKKIIFKHEGFVEPYGGGKNED